MRVHPLRNRKPHSLRRWLGGALVVMLILTLGACATSPTGRTQLTLFSSEEIAEMGNLSYAQMREEMPVVEEGDEADYVRCVAEPMLALLDDDADWQVTLFDRPEVNAFAVPGNNIGIFRGLLDVAETQHQLATVIGHEIAHVLADHGNERLSTQFATGAALELASAVAGGTERGQMVMAALGLGAQVGVVLPFSRAQETEADILGLELMADAGFDPRESTVLWENMAAAAAESPPEFLSTHPGTDTRIDELEANMDAAMERFRTARDAGRQPDCVPPERVGST